MRPINGACTAPIDSHQNIFDETISDAFTHGPKETNDAFSKTQSTLPSSNV